MAEKLRLMHVHAHPDDESSKGAASTARYVAEGVDVHVVTCTGGERGSILNPSFDHPGIVDNPELIGEIRREEMDRAREILGITQDWLGFVDSGWPEGDPPPPLPEGCFALVPVEEAAKPLIAPDALVPSARRHHVRRERRLSASRPHHVPQGQRLRLRQAGDADAYPELGEPWQPQKLYYHRGWSRARAEAIDAALERHGLEPVYRERLKEWSVDPRTRRRG